MGAIICGVDDSEAAKEAARVARVLGAKLGHRLVFVRVVETASTCHKTSGLAKQFGKLGLENALIIDGTEIDANFRNAARNIPNIDVLPVQGINVYDILRRKTLVLTKAALDALEARFK